MGTVIKVENLSKQYRLGQVGTGTISHDVNRWWHKIRGKEDPYLTISESNDRAVKGESDYVWALKDINFEVKQGEVLGIIGRNGAGKSTLLKILSRTTAPTTGSVKIKGRVASLLEVGTGFHPELSGRDNIFLNGAILGMSRREIERKFDEIVDFAGVERYIDTPVKRYSSGMYVRLAFAVAAHLDPEILIVDEVLAVGDIEFQKKCLGKMKDVSVNQGRTVLFVSHNLHAIKQLCKKSALFINGKLDILGDINECIDRYQSEEIRVVSKKRQNGIYSFNYDKEGNEKKYGILKVQISSDGEVTNTIFSSRNLKFEIFFNAKRNFEKGEIGVVIRDKNEISYLGFNNNHYGKKLEIKEGFAKAVIEINSFPLYANESYLVDLFFGDVVLSEYESIRNAFILEVKPMDIFNAGAMLDAQWNKIFLTDVNFKII